MVVGWLEYSLSATVERKYIFPHQKHNSLSLYIRDYNLSDIREAIQDASVTVTSDLSILHDSDPYMMYWEHQITVVPAVVIARSAPTGPVC
jgi:hypothetical protein